MRRLALPLALFSALIIGAILLSRSAPLPLPTPAQQDLVVLTQLGPLSYDDSDPQNIGGLEHDLIQEFARELGVGVQYIVADASSMSKKFSAQRSHLAAAWLSPEDFPESTHSTAFLKSLDVLVQHDASLPVDEETELAGRTIHVIANSRQANTARALQKRISGVQVVEHEGMAPFSLLEAVATQRYELALVDEFIYEVALEFAPLLQATLEFGEAQPVVWAFPPNTNPELISKANAFLQNIQKDAFFDRLRDRYFGHVRRLETADIALLLERSKTVLPKLRPYFEDAQITTGIDWRLLAALAWQESKWEANATSPTGVRGIMMLTEETADRLQVSNRLDPKESIKAGGRYLEYLRDQLPSSAIEPDRTWLALAAYNIGPGHFSAARTIAKQQKADPDSWLDMKRILPLLAKPEYYQRLKSGRARGGEAVILVENIRSFYDILGRQEAPYRPLEIRQQEKSEAANGLKNQPNPPGIKKR